MLFSSCTNHYKDGKMLFNKGVREKSTDDLNNAALELEMISYNQKNYDEAQKLILRIDSVILTWKENERRRLERQADSLRVVEQEIQERLRLERKNLNLKSEQAIRDFFDKNGTEHIEGIWEYSGVIKKGYRLAVIKRDNNFHVTILEKNGYFYPGNLKANFEAAASDDVLTINWKMGDKKTIDKTIGIVKSNSIIEFTIDKRIKAVMYRVYPKLEDIGKTKTTTKGEWKGNGSGFFISESGYIVTNHHVIDGASKIEVVFKHKNKINEFNAKVIQSDETNDLAIIKIDDSEFSHMSAIPYNFKTRSVDVGSEVFALGYPMALTIMGKEIKFTDGKISSKTGFKGNITTYQTTTPIQPGNSGGPLFDFKGNLIGVNSAILKTDVAENVSYSIKSSYLLNLIDVLPETISLPSNTQLASKPLTEQIKLLSDYVVLIKVK